MMKNIPFEDLVEADISLSFAWLRNWDDPPAHFQLDGPFASGVWGTTVLPGQEPLRWRIREVRLNRSFIIEMPLDRAVLSFEWSFEGVSPGRTRITQRTILSGDNGTAYAPQVRDSFGLTLADGMKRIADAMVSAERSAEAGGDDQ